MGQNKEKQNYDKNTFHLPRQSIKREIDNFDDYIAILRYLWNVIESNPIYKAIITKDMLCAGWDGKVVKEVMNALNDGE